MQFGSETLDKRNLIRRLFRNEAGNILLISAAAIPVLIGAAGLATDTVQWTLWKRQLQRQADSGALAGAYARAQSKNVTASATADINRNSQITLLTTPVIENAPTTGAYAGNSNAVRVVLKTQRSLAFSGLFLATAPTLTVEATAAVLSNGNYCMIALENTNTTGIYMQGNATVNLGCGMASNATNSTAVSAGGSSTVIATPVAAVGGITQSSNFLSPTTFQPYSIPQIDPYASLPTPAPSSCSGKVSVGPNSTRDLTPGCYNGIDAKGVLNLAAGTYYINSSSFDVGSQAMVTGTGVTIILTSTTAATDPSSIATVNINGGATVNLVAPTSGTYSGVLFYQDRRAPYGSNKINGNSSSKYEGTIYMPAQQVEWTGTSGMNTNCLQIVSRRISFSGNSTINNSCPPGSGGHSFQGTRVLLVG